MGNSPEPYGYEDKILAQFYSEYDPEHYFPPHQVYLLMQLQKAHHVEYEHHEFWTEGEEKKRLKFHKWLFEHEIMNEGNGTIIPVPHWVNTNYAKVFSFDPTKHGVTAEETFNVYRMSSGYAIRFEDVYYDASVNGLPLNVPGRNHWQWLGRLDTQLEKFGYRLGYGPSENDFQAIMYLERVSSMRLGVNLTYFKPRKKAHIGQVITHGIQQTFQLKKGGEIENY